MLKLIGSCCLLLSFSAFAQNPSPQTYGTQDEIAVVVQATAFTPWNSSNTYGGGIAHRYVNSNNGCCLVAPVSLPAGATVIGLEIQGCDYSTTAGITALFGVCDVNSNCTVLTPYLVSNDPGTPGCQNYRVNFTSPYTVHGSDSFNIDFYHQGDETGQVYIRAARVYYKLQVSPAPSTARYTDVPTTHAFFQYIEALASAGITAGCSTSPPQFCPDAPLTRGQMAVFLARALGLHWVP